MTNLSNYQNKIKEISKKYLNNEISYEEFKEQTLDLTKKTSPIAGIFKSEVTFINENDEPSNFNFGNSQIA